MSAEERAAQGYEGPPGPAPVVSRKGTEKTKNNKKLLEINQEIQLAPIKTIKARSCSTSSTSARAEAGVRRAAAQGAAQVSVDKSLKVNPKKGDEESTTARCTFAHTSSTPRSSRSRRGCTRYSR